MTTDTTPYDIATVNPDLRLRAQRWSRSAVFEGALGAGCLLWVAAIASLTSPEAASPVLVASMGASAVLLYTAPQSPMASTWSLFGGHLLSAIVGVTVQRLTHGADWAGPVAVGLAIAVMHRTGSLHPPGGATALFAVIGPPSLHALGYRYVLDPVLLNVVAFYSYFVVARRLRHWLAGSGLAAPPAALSQIPSRLRLTEADIGAARERLENYVDATDEQLLELANLAYIHHVSLPLAGKPVPLASEENRPRLEFATKLVECWRLFHRSRFEYLPVLDRAGRLMGVVSRRSLLDVATARGADRTVPASIVATLRESGDHHNDAPEVAGQLMIPCPLRVSTQSDRADAFRHMLGAGAECVAIEDAAGRYVGLITDRALVEP